MRRILPNLVIIGAPRCATTSLARDLGGHPQVYMSTPKELYFFDRRFDRGLDWYARHFARAVGKAVAGEATPRYLYSEQAMARMVQVIPQARLIAILRHPVDRAYSYYWHRRARWWEPREFSEIVAAELAAWESREPAQSFYLEGSRYLKYLDRVCRYFPREALHVLIFEELRDAPGLSYEAVCRFLDIDSTFVPSDLGRRRNPFVAYRSLALRKLAFRLPPPVRHLVNWVNARAGSYPPLDPGMRRALSERFAQENADLAAWLGRDLSVWSPSAP